MSGCATMVARSRRPDRSRRRLFSPGRQSQSLALRCLAASPPTRDRAGAPCRAPMLAQSFIPLNDPRHTNWEEAMREAVIVAAARTPIGRAYRGAFNDTQAQALAGHVVGEVVRRAGIDPAEVEDVVIGAAMQQGSSGYNIARQAAIRA